MFAKKITTGDYVESQIPSNIKDAPLYTIKTDVHAIQMTHSFAISTGNYVEYGVYDDYLIMHDGKYNVIPKHVFETLFVKVKPVTKKE